MNLILISIFIFLSYTNFLLGTHGSNTPSYNLCCMHETPSKIKLRHREHQGVGYKTGYTTVEAFLTPNWIRNFQPYADIRGHIMNNGEWATNIGLGARGAPFEKLILGGNFYFDYREAHGMPCYQLGSGIELLSTYINFRLNGYLPIGEKKHISRYRFKRFERNNIILKQSVKASLVSAYAEIEGRIPKLPEGFQLYVAAGPYYLGSSKTDIAKHKMIKFGNKWGGKYRVSARVSEYFDAGIELTHDALFHTNIQGYLGFSLPLGPTRMYSGFKKRENQEKCRNSRNFRQKITQAVHRNEIIPVYKKGVTIEATAENGHPIEFVFVSHETALGGDGTFEKPFQNIIEAESLKKGYIIKLDNKNDAMTQPVILEPTDSISPHTSDVRQVSALSRVLAEFYGVDFKQPED